MKQQSHLILLSIVLLCFVGCSETEFSIGLGSKKDKTGDSTQGQQLSVEDGNVDLQSGSQSVGIFSIKKTSAEDSMVVLVQDVSSSMSSFNSKYGNKISADLAVKTADVNAKFYTCADGSSKATAINRAFDSLLSFMNIGAGDANNCRHDKDKLKLALKNLEQPTNLAIILITDYTASSIPSLSSPEAVDELFAQMEKFPNINSVSISGIIRVVPTAGYLTNLGDRAGVFSSGADTADEFFAKIGLDINSRSIVRQYPFSGDSQNSTVTLNGQELSIGTDYEVSGDKITFLDTLTLNEGDKVIVD
jgi:hypothetical protein